MRRLLIVLSALLPLAVMAGITASASDRTAVATFAAGCFWCTESDFDKVAGVLKTTSGYMGGHVKNPTYQQVSRGGTGHAEVLQVTYDPGKVSYKRLLEVFWHNVDPFDLKGQFCDRGDQYRPEIFVHSAEQRQLAETSKEALNSSGRFEQTIEVPITDASTFTAAETYHQDFYRKNPGHYQRYRVGCRRDARLEQVWGKKKEK